jgi:hypothetical protein
LGGGARERFQRATLTHTVAVVHGTRRKRRRLRFHRTVVYDLVSSSRFFFSLSF